MPFAARGRHQFWSADVRYVDNDEVGGRAYVISVLDNHSRAILSSAVARTQDLASYLSVLYAAVERYGSPEALVSDGGGRLPRHPGEGRLRGFGHRQARDRARQAVAELHRDPF